MNTDELRRAARSVYLACHEDVADDLATLLIQAAQEIDALRAAQQGEKE